MVKKPISIVYGGTFHPFHEGHLWVLKQLDLQAAHRILVMPNRYSPHKGSQTEAFGREKIADIHQALQGHAFQTPIEVSDIEVKREGPSYTLETIQILKKEYPNETWHLAMGADAFLEFHTWQGHEEIMTQVEFMILTRPGVGPEQVEKQIEALKLSGRVLFIKGEGIDISSSALRIL